MNEGPQLQPFCSRTITSGWIGDPNLLDASLPEPPEQRRLSHHNLDIKASTIGIHDDVLTALDVSRLHVCLGLFDRSKGTHIPVFVDRDWRFHQSRSQPHLSVDFLSHGR